MSVTVTQVGAATVVGGAVAGGAFGALYGGRAVPIGLAVGVSATAGMVIARELSDNGAVGAAAGIGTGAAVGAAMMSLSSSAKFGLGASRAAALGAAIGGVSMLLGIGLATRFASGQG